MAAQALIAEQAPLGRLTQRPQWSEVLANPMRAFHTVRHLQPRQIAYQALRRMQPIEFVDSQSEGALTLLDRRPVLPADLSQDAFDGRSFCFLNRRFLWEGEGRWHPRDADDLWVFNLHYFRFLASTPADRAQYLIRDWIAMNRDPRSAAWHPYPISLRTREWIEWLHARQDAPAALRQAMERSIASQVEALRRRLEFNLMGNHLLENAISLCWAGLSFGGTAAWEWLADGETLLEQELRTQILDDGSHEERSPMYQAQLAEALLRLAEVAGQSAHPAGRRLAAATGTVGARMLAALELMVHPDGEYALVNDTALGVAPSLQALRNRFGGPARPERRSPWALHAGGFYGCRGRDRYLLFDAGPIGPDHQPGHGHAGALSFELSSRGRRIVTDTGVFTYAGGAERRHDRSTFAHNTIEIDGRDQSDVWGSFRCGRRSAIVAAGMAEGRDGPTLVGAYRGPGRGGARSVSHEREIFINARVLAFTDRVTASGHHRAALRLHLAPGLQITSKGRTCRIADERRRPIGALVGNGFDWTQSSSSYHPEFGREVERPCLSAHVGFRDAVVAKWWLILS